MTITIDYNNDKIRIAGIEYDKPKTMLDLKTIIYEILNCIAAIREEPEGIFLYSEDEDNRNLEEEW